MTAPKLENSQIPKRIHAIENYDMVAIVGCNYDVCGDEWDNE